MWPFKKKTQPKIEIPQPLPYTPDAAFLETVDPWLLFIFDDLQRHHQRHRKLMDAGVRLTNPLRPNDTQYGYSFGKFVLWKHRDALNSFPVALDMAPRRFRNVPEWDMVSPTEAHIKGQLYYTDWKGLAMLDEHYRNTVEFKRRRISIVVPYHYQFEEADGSVSMSLQHHHILTAWAYIGIQEFWDQHLDGTFVPVKRFHPKYEILGFDIPDYYFFTNIEYLGDK